MNRWERLSHRPPASETRPIRLAKMAEGRDERRVLLVIPDDALLETLRRSLLRNGVWCAPCLSRADVLPMLSAVPFSSVVVDYDHPELDAHVLLREIPMHYGEVSRIALTRRTSLRTEIAEMADHVLLHPLDMTELVSAILKVDAVGGAEPGLL